MFMKWIVFLLWPILGTTHEFHLSKCTTHFDADENALQISLLLFIDDLEEALRRQGADHLKLCTAQESEKAEAAMQTYLQKHFIIKIDGISQKLNFIGKEPSEDLQAVWCYFEITNVKSMEKVEFINNILLEVFDDQKNLVNFTVPGKKNEYMLFHKGKATEVVDF